MSMRRSGLGRNLSALLSHVNNENVPAYSPNNDNSSGQNLSIHHLQPGKYQPRGEMDETALEELTDSIRKQGLLQPLVVRKLAEDRFEIIAGERRWRACQRAGLSEVPVVLRQ